MTTALTDSRIDRLLRWQAGERPGPWSITIYPTNKCNLPCQHCWLRWGEYDKTYKSEMSDDRLLELVEEAADLGVREWVIVGGGDPMIRSKTVIEMCSRIRDRGMNGMLHTNGTLFRQEHLEALIAMDWERVCISLDGPDAESNNTIRGAGFEKAIRNVHKLRDLRTERGASSPAMSFHSVVTNLNYDRLNELVELADECGCDTVNLTLLLVESDLSRPFALTDEQKIELRDHVARAIALADELGIQNNFPIFLCDEVIADSTHMQHGDTRVRADGFPGAMCFEPFSTVTIQPDGRTGPCCVFWDEKANSVKEQSLSEVWHGPYLEHVRDRFLRNEPMHYCSLCPSSLYARIDATREELLGRNLSGRQRLGRIFDRGVRSLREDGVGATVRRGMRWAHRVSQR